MTPTLEQIEDSERICDAATEGPWGIYDNGFDGGVVSGLRDALEGEHSTFDCGKVYKRFVCGSEPHEGRMEPDSSDTIFISHARTMLPEMLKLVREMYGVLLKYHNSGAERLLVHEGGKEYYECLLCKNEWPQGDDTESHAKDCAFIQGCRVIERMEGGEEE